MAKVFLGLGNALKFSERLYSEYMCEGFLVCVFWIFDFWIFTLFSATLSLPAFSFLSHGDYNLAACVLSIQHVSVVGRPLSGFKLHPFEDQRKFTLEYCGHDKLLEPDNVPYLSSGKGNPTQFRKFQGTSSQPNLKSTSKRNLMLDVLDQIPRQPSPVSVPLINNSGTSSSGSIEGGESQFRKYEGGLPDAEPELTPKRNLMLDIMRQISSQKNSTYSGNFVKNVRAPEGDRIAEAWEPTWPASPCRMKILRSSSSKIKKPTWKK